MGPDDGTDKTELPPVHSADADPSQELETMTTIKKDDVIFCLLPVEADRARCERNGGHWHLYRVRGCYERRHQLPDVFSPSSVI